MSTLGGPGCGLAKNSSVKWPCFFAGDVDERKLVSTDRIAVVYAGHRSMLALHTVPLCTSNNMFPLCHIRRRVKC